MGHPVAGGAGDAVRAPKLPAPKLFWGYLISGDAFRQSINRVAAGCTGRRGNRPLPFFGYSVNMLPRWAKSTPGSPTCHWGSGASDPDAGVGGWGLGRTVLGAGGGAAHLGLCSLWFLIGTLRPLWALDLPHHEEVGGGGWREWLRSLARCPGTF